MGRERRTCLIIHQLFCIAVVCTDKHLSVYLFDGFHCSAHTFIYCLHSFNSRCFHPCMTYHIRICKIDNDDIILAGFNCPYQLIADFICAHLGL